MTLEEYDYLVHVEKLVNEQTRSLLGLIDRTDGLTLELRPVAQEACIDGLLATRRLTFNSNQGGGLLIFHIKPDESGKPTVKGIDVMIGALYLHLTIPSHLVLPYFLADQMTKQEQGDILATPGKDRWTKVHGWFINKLNQSAL
jgi:hypothetical protein